MFDFLTVFLNFSVFLENYPNKSEGLISIDGTGCLELLYTALPKYSNTNKYGPWKKKNRFFDRFLKLFDFSRKLLSQI